MTSYDDGRKLDRTGLVYEQQNHGQSRSIDLSLLAPLFAGSALNGSACNTETHDALEQETAGTGIVVDRSVDQFVSIDRFAAQIAAMDLVITIDNSTAHLAGALGIPTWVLLPFAPDWRWQLDRDDSPWYPAMRLFRQATGWRLASRGTRA